jgi:thioredoxin reductase
MPTFVLLKSSHMKKIDQKDVVIIGGSYAGISAALTLGRSLRDVLIFDSGAPCNAQTPHAQNLVTHDGDAPAYIRDTARDELLKYSTVQFLKDKVITAEQNEKDFTLTTAGGKVVSAKKLLLATGLKDTLPPIPGFDACWGISVLHCPYCHGYENHNKKTAVIASGETAFEFARLITNWTNDLTLLTNGPSGLSALQKEQLQLMNVRISETVISSLNHQGGYLTEVELMNGERLQMQAIYIRPQLSQHADLPAKLGCKFQDVYLQVDELQRTSVPGIFAAGDNCSPMRSLSSAIAAGGRAGAFINHELIRETFDEKMKRLVSSGENLSVL